MTLNSAILVSISELPEQLRSDVFDVIAMLNNDGCLFQYNEDKNKSHLLVIDMDDDSGKKHFTQSLSGQVKLLVSNQSISGKNIVNIKKPATIENLKTVLSKLYSMMQAHLVKVSSSLVTTEVTRNIQETIFYNLLEAKHNKHFLHIVSDDVEVFVDGCNQSLKSDSSLDEIRGLLSTSYNKVAVKKIDEVIFNDLTAGLHLYTLHNILWTSAIICSYGQILPGHDENKSVKLRAWPSFTRNDFKPEYLKIAAILAQRHISLVELSTLTNIPYSEIVNFYNAAYAVDLIDQNQVPVTSDVYATETRSKSVKSNLLNKIAARLGFTPRFTGTNHG